MKRTIKQSLDFTVRSLLMPGLLLYLQAGCSRQPPIASSLQALQGTWEGAILGQETNNKITLKFSGNALHFQWLEGNIKGNWYEATFALPAGTNPQQLRATITGYYPTNDTGARDIGRVVTAIFKIKEGTLTLAGIQDNNHERAKDIDPFEENTTFRYALRKVHAEASSR